MKAPLLLTAVVLSLAGAASAHAAPAVTGAWSRPATAGGTGAGFMTLTNPGKAANALVAAETAVAARTEIHRSAMRDGVASMHKVERLAVPAGATVTFAPGGLLLMFLRLAKPLNPGDTIPVTLTFASGAKATVHFKVGLGAPAAAHHHH